MAATAGGAVLVVSELFDWSRGHSAWEFFHGLDVALLVLGLAAAALGAASLLTPPPELPLEPGHAAAACGAIVTTVVLIFLDTSHARLGAYLGLIGGLATLVGGLVLSGGARAGDPLRPPPGAGQSPRPGWYPDPRRHARLRYWDGEGWSEQTRD